MKFTVHHSESFPPYYDLILDSGGSVEIFRIPEDFFFDLLSGSPVEYENVQAKNSGNGAISCADGKTAVEDSGEFTREAENSVILKGKKINGRLSIDTGSKMITLIPG